MAGGEDDDDDDDDDDDQDDYVAAENLHRPIRRLCQHTSLRTGPDGLHPDKKNVSRNCTFLSRRNAALRRKWSVPILHSLFLNSLRW
jgi:hypothetical protein